MKIKNKRIAFILFVVLTLIFWNLLDFLYTAFIVHSEYRFIAATDLIIPLAVAVCVGYLLFLRKQERRTDRNVNS